MIFSAQHDRLDILIGNAGIMACPFETTAQGFESQIGVNHFGHFTLVNKLMPALEKAGQADGARVVLLSSIGHRIAAIDFDDMHFASRDYDKWQSYGQSKTAKALQAVELDRRGKEKGIRAFSVHPGGIFTPLQRHLHNEEMVALGWTKEDGSPSDLAAAGFKTPPQGAAQACLLPPHPSWTGWAGFIAKIAILPNRSPPTVPIMTASALGRLTKSKLRSFGKKPKGKSQRFRPFREIGSHVILTP